jgi:hypothetical protein
MIILCYASVTTDTKNSNFRNKVCCVNGLLFPLLSRNRTIFNGRNFRISKSVNVGNLMLIFFFGFNTVKPGSRMFFYNNIHLIKTKILVITGLRKETKVFLICVECGLIRRGNVKYHQIRVDNLP